jgi:hypothetical protein
LSIVSRDSSVSRAHASPDKEVQPTFSDFPLPRRPESYIARTIIDRESLFEEAELYNLMRNEFLAVDIVFSGHRD